ncbi:hypothetical protein AAG570_003277 [Ranatra chinensis]|uniref:Uncharacterized protein n=1 Tax=Ranatra chinensis TaxID=642074 RepID=A0ABD0YIQ5_9HEMI
MRCSAKWVGLVQVLAWCSVAGFLFYRGLPEVEGTSGFVTVTVAVFMVLLGAVFLVFRAVDACYRSEEFTKLPQDDKPPNYEDVVANAPRYSSLFLNIETHEVLIQSKV